MKCAYVTLLTDDTPDFIYNIILVTSLLKTKTIHDIVLLYTSELPQYKLNIFRNFYTKMIKVEHVRTTQKVKSVQKVFNKNLSFFFTKFQIFNLTNYDKILYLDKYQLINKNIDFIFNLNYPAGFCYRNKFKRSHMFLIKPNEKIYDNALKIIDEIDLTQKYIDKNILNLLFNKINCFSLSLDFQKYIRDLNNNKFNSDELKIIDYNFIKKPLSFFKEQNLKNNNSFKKYNNFYIQWINIYKKLYNNFNKKKIDLRNLYSIISNDYDKFIKNQYPKLKKVKIAKNLYNILEGKLQNIINNHYTCKNIINYLRNNNIKIFIYGGTMRDLLNDTEVKDIDCIYIGDYKKVNELLKKIKNLNFKQGLFKKYFSIEEGEMELNNLDVLKKSLDGPCNSLLYDFDTKYIYDLTGSGIDDAKKKIWRLNPGDTHEEWSRDHNSLIHRLIKMVKKGFIISKEDKTFIYNELYYEKKDRSYWFYLKKPIDDDFKETVITDIDSLNLKYTGKEFVELIEKNLKRI